MTARASGTWHRFGGLLSVGILSACALHATPARPGTPEAAQSPVAAMASEPANAAAPEVPGDAPPAQAPAETSPTETPQAPSDATPARTPAILSGADAPVQFTIAAARALTEGLVLELRVYNRTKGPLRWLNDGVVRRLSVTTPSGEVEVEHSEPRDFLPTYKVLAEECDALDAPLILPHKSIAITVQSSIPPDTKAVALDLEIHVGAPDCEVASLVREHVAGPVRR